MLQLMALLMIMSEPATATQTTDSRFFVATYIDVQAKSTTQSIALIKQYREASRKESGNSSVDVIQEASRANRFVIVEVWKDQASFEAHEKAAHTVQFRDKLKAVHNSPYDQRVHQAFAIDPRATVAGSGAFVVTHVDVPPPRREETEALLKALAAEGRRDEGNVRYDVFQQTAPRTNHFTIFAAWKGRNTFDAHEIRPHTLRFRESLGPMLGAPYDERLYRPLD